MVVDVKHIDYPVPGHRDLATAIGGRRWSPLELALLAGSAIALSIADAPGAWSIVVVFALIVELTVSARTRYLVGSWRKARRRRRALNSAASREARRAALADRIAGLAHAADRAWKVFIADAVVGRTQSVINDRPAPKIQPLQQLGGIRALAADLNIVLQDEGPPEAGQARLPVPPEAGFAPDVLSPTMMNLNAASLAHASTEGAARARRRHQQAVAYAEEFGPMLIFADRAVAALREHRTVP